MLYSFCYICGSQDLGHATSILLAVQVNTSCHNSCDGSEIAGAWRYCDCGESELDVRDDKRDWMVQH